MNWWMLVQHPNLIKEGKTAFPELGDNEAEAVAAMRAVNKHQFFDNFMAEWLDKNIVASAHVKAKLVVDLAFLAGIPSTPSGTFVAADGTAPAAPMPAAISAAPQERS